MKEDIQFTPKDLVEEELVVPEKAPNKQANIHHGFIDRILHGQIVFEARKSVVKKHGGKSRH
jgi:hypothetical protein